MESKDDECERLAKQISAAKAKLAACKKPTLIALFQASAVRASWAIHTVGASFCLSMLLMIIYSMLVGCIGCEP